MSAILEHYAHVAAMQGRKDIPRTDIIKLAAFGGISIHDAKMAAQFCTAVWKVCYAGGDHNTAACVDAGLIDLLVACMRIHKADVTVQSAAVVACHNYLIDNPRGQAGFMAANGLTALTSVCNLHRPNDSITSFACRIVRLVTTSALHDDVVQAGGVALVCKVMKAHPDSADLQKWGSNALLAFAAGPGKPAAKSAGAIFILQDALKTHSSNPDVVKNCTEALRLLQRATE